MQKWEYQFIPLWNGTAKDLRDVMNMLGEEGWEFVGEIHHNTDDEYVILKRPKET